MISTDQKEVLFNGISKYLRDYKVESLLDIGAGDGSLAKRLASRVSEYYAVERNTKNLQTLESLSLEIIDANFPENISIEKKFDMVLVSHSIPEEGQLYEPFLKKAWDFINKPSGVLLIVTFKGGKGEFTNLTQKWGDDKCGDSFDEDLYNTILEILKTLGDVTVSRFTSKFESESIDEIVEFTLSSVKPKSGVKDGCRKDLKKIIGNKYFSDGKYFFPWEHLFVSCSPSVLRLTNN